MKRIFKVVLLSFFVVTIIAEVCLRAFLGFCNAPLYLEDKDFEYMTKPNQDLVRFGKHFHTNSYNQRSEEPDTSKTIVLGLGDSVLFGTTMVSNEDTSPYVFEEMTGIQMLNISAGSWGPDNCVEYIRKYGLFEAKAVWLLVSSHDAYDNISHQKVVGKSVSYPSKNYTLALEELFIRYIKPRIFKNKDISPDQKVLNSIDKRSNQGGSFNTGFEKLKQICKDSNIQFYMCLHCDCSELDAREYNEQGKKIIEWCKNNDIPLFLDMKEGITKEMYQDAIHLNKDGQRFEAMLMKKYICLR